MERLTKRDKDGTAIAPEFADETYLMQDDHDRFTGYITSPIVDRLPNSKTSSKAGSLVELNPKPLTVEELKALKVGDWVWIVDKAMNLTHYRQKNHHDTTHCLFERCINDMALNIFRWKDYGKTWTAYKNKE